MGVGGGGKHEHPLGEVAGIMGGSRSDRMGVGKGSGVGVTLREVLGSGQSDCKAECRLCSNEAKEWCV